MKMRFSQVEQEFLSDSRDDSGHGEDQDDRTDTDMKRFDESAPSIRTDRK